MEMGESFIHLRLQDLMSIWVEIGIGGFDKGILEFSEEKEGCREGDRLSWWRLSFWDKRQRFGCLFVLFIRLFIFFFQGFFSCASFL